jgi:hypothetical protein
MHRLKLKQAVVPAHSGRERHEVYEVVRLMPALPNGEVQYRIKGRESGVERVVRDSEIKPLFE